MKNYKLVYSKDFQKLFKKLDPSVQKLLASWIKKNLENTSDPRTKGKAVTGELKSFWRYRILNYRLIVEIQDDVVIIVLVTFGHRKEVYR